MVMIVVIIVVIMVRVMVIYLYKDQLANIALKLSSLDNHCLLYVEIFISMNLTSITKTTVIAIAKYI